MAKMRADDGHIFAPSFRKGSGWMGVSLFCFTGNALLLRYLGATHGVSPWVALLFRAVVGFALVCVVFPVRGTAGTAATRSAVDVRRAATSRMLVSRGILGAFGTAAYYVTLPILGAGKATLIGNTWVIWSALMAVFMLKEHLGARQIAGIVIAIGGLALLTGTDHPAAGQAHTVHEIIAIGGALIAAGTVVVIRQLTRTESSATIFASQCIYTALLSLPCVIADGLDISFMQAALLSVAALAAGVGQLAMTEGFRHLPVSTGGAFQVALPLCITLASVALFGESFTLPQAAGAALIILGGYQAIGRKI